MKFTSLIVLSSLALVSCAHRAQKPTKAEYGWRVENRGVVSTGMPNYALSTEAYTAAKVVVPELTRKPASDEALAQELEAHDKKPSLRRLYFRALYQQFKDLKSSVATKSSIKSCPQFHHDKILVDETAKALTFGPSFARPSAQELAFYPEWMLPSKSNKTAAPVWARKGNSQKLLGQALRVHTNKVQRELRALCEDGATDAYFRLENMVTYFSGHPDKQEKMGLESFLKIPAFSTMLLLRSTAQGPGTLSPHDQSLLEEVKAPQFQRYINELRKRRFKNATSAL